MNEKPQDCACNAAPKIPASRGCRSERSQPFSSACACPDTRSDNAGLRLVFACSGAADVGAIADQAARQLTREGKGKMFCTVGIGGRIPGIMQTTAAADQILAIDGCPLNCVKHCLEQAGLANFAHLQLADLGMEKGKTPPTSDNIAQAAAHGAELLA